jgi:hypothetical protein
MAPIIALIKINPIIEKTIIRIVATETKSSDEFFSFFTN